MKRRHCMSSRCRMSAGEMHEVQDSMADLAIHNLSNNCTCGKHSASSVVRPKRRSCHDQPLKASGLPDENEFDPDLGNILSAVPHLPQDGLLCSASTLPDAASSRKVPTVFRWDGDGKKIYLCGSFDNWKMKIPLVQSQTGFLTVVDIPEGEHQYKYLVDGHWRCLSNEPKVQLDNGFENNVVTVRSSDFDIFEALDIDSGIDKIKSAEEKWTQYIPPRDTGYSYLRAGPPLLPPHLLGTVLNERTSSHCDPTMLAEPNHVILNHLYTLSIKDGVLVLGATHRYRRKYITTLLYKPI